MEKTIMTTMNESNEIIEKMVNLDNFQLNWVYAYCMKETKVRKKTIMTTRKALKELIARTEGKNECQILYLEATNKYADGTVALHGFAKVLK